MRSKISIGSFVLVVFLFCSTGGRVQSRQQTVDAETMDQLNVIMTHLLETIYVWPEIGKRLAAQLQTKFDSGAYKNVATASGLAEAITRDLREVYNDKHLAIRYNPANDSEAILNVKEWELRRAAMFPRETSAPQSGRQTSPGPQASSRMLEQLQQANYHFRETKILNGNIGYLDLGGFAPGQGARDAAAKAMANLADSDAVIIDLRRCPGGTSEMVEFLASYFFDKEPRVLMSRYIRPTGQTIESKTVADVPGKRMPGTDLYLLVSATTASACESFPYTLQQYGRAEVVGERTAGAGYNNVIIPLGKGFSFSISFGRPTHPRSGKGWEGEGVQPDIAVAAANALQTAQQEALKKLIGKTTDERHESGLVAALKAVTHNVGADPSAGGLQDYVGRYGNKEITVQDGGLYYQRIGGRGGPLRTAGKDQFALNTDAQITFTRDANQVVTGMTIDWVEREKEQLKREPLTPGLQTQAGPIRRIEMSSPSSHQSPSPRAVDDASLARELGAYLEPVAKTDSFSGAVLIAKKGEPVFEKAYGMADKSRNTLNEINTKFDLGSMNKMFTAVAIAQLVERGKLSFDDTVGKLLPNYPNKAVAAKVTVHQLLTHTSGMGSYFNEKFRANLNNLKTVADYLPLFVDEPLAFEPGSKWQYSNSGFVVLGLIVEKVSGQSYYDYVKQHITKPAGMVNTDSYERDKEVEKLAIGYTKAGEDGRPDPSGTRRANTSMRPPKGSPAGGGYSTLHDLLKFSLALQSHKLLTPKYTDIVTTGKVEMAGPGRKYGYGFGEEFSNGRRIVGHNGGGPGIGANLDIFFETGYTVVVLGNYDPPAIMPVVMKIRDLLPEPATTRPER